MLSEASSRANRNRLCGENLENDAESKRDKLYSRISFWFAVFLSTLILVLYFERNPPDTEEVKKMRFFFRDNIMEVARFIKMTPEEMDVFAAMKKHPFYKTYVKASPADQGRIRALIHISGDYNANQYWFSLVFGWMILFAAIWFLGAITEGIIILVRQGNDVKPPA